jgi:hypothetical protein
MDMEEWGELDDCPLALLLELGGVDDEELG